MALLKAPRFTLYRKSFLKDLLRQQKDKNNRGKVDLNSIMNHAYIMSQPKSCEKEVRENLSFPVLLTIIFFHKIRSNVTLLLLLKKLKQQ